MNKTKITITELYGLIGRESVKQLEQKEKHRKYPKLVEEILGSKID